MAVSPQVDRLTELMKLTDRMLGEVSKDRLAEAARILAIELGHYQYKFGLLEIEESVEMLKVSNLNEEQATWVADGLENLVAVIACGEEDEPVPRQH